MNSAIGSSWEDLRTEFYSSDEIAEMDMQAEIVIEFIKARQESGISRQELEAKSGVKQSSIVNFEHGGMNQTILTLQKLLKPLGKRLAIVPIKPSI